MHGSCVLGDRRQVHLPHLSYPSECCLFLLHILGPLPTDLRGYRRALAKDEIMALAAMYAPVAPTAV